MEIYMEWLKDAVVWVGLLGPVVVSVMRFLAKKTDNETIMKLSTLAEAVVLQVEKDYPDETGPDKKDVAMRLLADAVPEMKKNQIVSQASLVIDKACVTVKEKK